MNNLVFIYYFLITVVILGGIAGIIADIIIALGGI